MKKPKLYIESDLFKCQKLDGKWIGIDSEFCEMPLPNGFGLLYRLKLSVMVFMGKADLII